MTLIHTLNKKVKVKTVQGPASYNVTTGWVVAIDELNYIESAMIGEISPLLVNNYVHAVRITSISGNIITLRVYRIDVTAAAPSAWTEVPNATDISALQVGILAVGN